ncbi:L,D-transpeptidase [Phormidium sp. LEGE 05292]|uniref:L,D-transpeptidase n=1 Tax=[Phormidium] sp. LEGE 05292 TaxID=767427 RepID=UPI00187E57BD|nr:L,D-transpeptidase [Phormidium sp. LEGE 05292]MBE9225792.1 L,D-transpeptidase [Phormidium sp. LEGE 05292]
METIIRSTWLRRSSVFWVSLALAIATLFAWTVPTSAASRSSRGGSGRWIEVDLSSQRLYAWQNGRRIYSSRISSGKRSTPTRLGTFAIQRKYLYKTMRGRGYVAPNVPYTMFYSGGYAIHGAYWHNRFGTPITHGCVNLPVGKARQLYSWAGPGTRVVIRR